MVFTSAPYRVDLQCDSEVKGMRINNSLRGEHLPRGGCEREYIWSQGGVWGMFVLKVGSFSIAVYISYSQSSATTVHFKTYLLLKEKLCPLYLSTSNHLNPKQLLIDFLFL